MEGVQGLERARTSDKVRTAGVLCAIGGAGWLVNGVLSLVMSQPGGVAFAISGVFWIAIQSLLLIGVLGLSLSGAAPGWLGGISLGLALLGRGDFVTAAIHSLIIGYDSSRRSPIANARSWASSPRATRTPPSPSNCR